MERLVIACERCGVCWSLDQPLNLYEERALETHPCPACRTRALCCQDVDEKPMPDIKVPA